MAVVCLFLFPTIVSILSQLLRSRRLSFGRTQLLSWCFFSLVFVSLSFPVFSLTGQLSVKASYHDGIPMFSYTGVVPAVLLAASAALSAYFSRHTLEYAAVERPKLSLLSFLSMLVRLLLHAFLYILIFLTLAYLWSYPRYDNINLEEVFFYLSMPLQGTAEGFTQDVVQHVLVPSLIIFALIELAVWFPFRKHHVLRGAKSKRKCISLFPLRFPHLLTAALLLSWFMILYVCGDSYLDITTFINSRIHQSTLIRDEYVEPKDVAITFPEKKRNLICIYVESAETTSQDKANGGIFDVNHIPEMTRLAKENVSFSQSDLLHGASIAPACGWTIAGLVAESAGLPLKYYTYEPGTLGLNNKGDEFAYLLPGATTLGDILEDAGYRNVFMAGSDFVFGGRTVYYSQHGNYEIFDLITARQRGLIDPYYMVGWGFEDEKLYEFAKAELTEIAASSQPFNFSMLTVDTHAPFYECRLCPEDIEEHHARVLACSSAQLDDFISWCKEQPFYENTTIAIMGDHASIVGDFYDSITGSSLDSHHGSTSRLVYNAFINSPVQPVKEKNRLFTTLDFFPTTLASLGVTIEGDRLALGVNLFSDEQTLSEKYGYETLYEELEKKSIFYNQELLYP